MEEPARMARAPCCYTGGSGEVGATCRQFRESVDYITKPTFEEFYRSFYELPERTQRALIRLGTHGWFFDLEMSLPELWELNDALREGNVVKAENALVEYYVSRTDEIGVSLGEMFPTRQKFIRAAFNAHQRGEYALSIPVLFAQTDGICKEMVDNYLFTNRNRKPQTAALLDQFATNAFLSAVLSPLGQTLPIGASKGQRDETFSELNRHMVLHGESLNYDTKKNSLKAISLINYVGQVVWEISQDPDRFS